MLLSGPRPAASVGRFDRLLGLVLFLPVPAVLWLFTRAPLGPLASLGAGVLVMATHQLYARPFALSRAARRCLWCGGSITRARVALEVREPVGTGTWSACRPSHAEAIAGLLEWAARHACPLRAGILGTLLAFLMAATLAGLGRLGAVSHADAAALFQLGIAASVLPLGWLSGRARPGARIPAAPLRSPFPVHIQSLIGTRAVLWLFRLVGLYWLAAGCVHVARRAAWP